MPLVRKKPSTRTAAANRANSLHSTGPKSVRGKLQSSGNAIKYGIHSNVHLRRLEAAGESAEELEQIQRALCEAFRPNDSFEQILVEDMALLRWRGLRVLSLERETWQQHQTGALRARRATIDALANRGPQSGVERDEILRKSYELIIEDQTSFGSLSEPSTDPHGVGFLVLALMHFKENFTGFMGSGLDFLKALYGTNPTIGGRTILAQFEKCMAEDTSVKLDREEFFRNLDSEIHYYTHLSNCIEEHRAQERERVISTFRGRNRHTDALSDDRLLVALQRSGIDSVPGEALDRISRYESHLERQFERKLQQFVAWRRAKNEPIGPVSAEESASK